MRRPGYCHLLSTSFLFVVLLLQPYHVNASWVSNLLQSVGRLFDHRGPRSLDEPVEDSAGNAPGTVGIMWGMPDTEAAVGKLFRFPIPENAFSGNIDQYRIENVGDNTLPSWLYFNQTSKILYGVPSYADQGNIMLQVTAFGRRHNNSAHVPNATAAFLVRVHAGSHNSWFNDIDIETETSDKKDHKSSLPDCNWDENIIHATLILDADMTSLKSLNRVKILYKAAHFLQRPVLSITLTPKKNSVIAKLLDTSVLIAGPGNAPIKTKNPGVEVSWIIACGDFQNTDDISHIMSHNIQSGRITQELGHHIIGWHVTQTLPPENIRKLRIKRQAGRRKTAIPTPTLHPTATITRPSTGTSTSTSSSSSSKSSEIKPTRTVSSSEILTISSQSQTSSSSIPTVPSTSPLSQTVSDEISTSSMSIIEPSETFIFSTSSSSLDSTLESSNIIPTSVPASVLESTESIIQGFTTEPSMSLESSPSQELTITFSLEPSISVEASSSEELAITLFSDFLSGESPLISTEPSISISFTEILTQESLLSGTYESLIMTTPPLTDMASVSDSEQSLFLTIIETQEFSESLKSQSSVSAESTLFMESSLSDISSLTLGETFGPSTGVADSTDITESSFQTFETIGVTTIEISPSILVSSPVSSEIFYSSMENSSASESISSQSSALIGSSTDDFFTSAATTDSMIMASSESEMSTSVLDTIPVTPSESSDFPTTSLAITEPPSTPPLTPVTATIVMPSASDAITSTGATATSSPGIEQSSEAVSENSSIISSTRSMPVTSSTTVETAFSMQPSSTPSSPTLTASSQPTGTPVSSEAVTTPAATVTVVTTGTVSATSTATAAASTAVVTMSSEGITTFTPTAAITTTTAAAMTTPPPTTQGLTTSTPTATTTFPTTAAVTGTISTTMGVITPPMTTGAITTPPPATTAVTTLGPTTVAINTAAATTAAITTAAATTAAVTTAAATTAAVTTPTATTAAVTTPTATTAAVTTPTATTAAVTTPAATTVAVTTPASTTAAVTTPVATTGAITTPAATSAAITTPAVTTPGITTASPTNPATRTESTTLAPANPTLTSTITTPSATTNSMTTTPSETPAPSNPSNQPTTRERLETRDPPNRPPQILNPINKLVIKIGSYFRVQVPMDTFFDYEDGGTRNLKLNLTTIMGGPVGPSSFVQFDSVNQTLYGLALPQDLQPEPHKVLLRAEDSGGAIATDVIEIIINTSGLDDISFTLEAWFQLEYVNFIGDRENVVNLVKRIAVFYGDKPDYYTIASIQKGSVVFLWTDSRVSKDECQNNTIQSLYEAIYSDGGINGTFRKILLPEFPISHISLNLMHVCAYPEETTTVVYPTTAAAAVAGASTNLILAIVLPIIIIFIIIAVALIIFCCLRKKHTSAYIPEDEKPIYSKNRKPVLLENELEMRDVHNQPRKPTVLDTDVPQGLFDNPAYLGPEDERRAPPPYAVPRAGGFGPDFDQAQSQSPPPLYFIDAPDGARPDLPKPPAYRLPPPYLSYPGSSDI